MKKRFIATLLCAFAVLCFSAFAFSCGGNETSAGISVSLNLNSAKISVGGGVQLLASTQNYSGKTEWSSSDESVAAVSENGFVTGVSTGSCVVTAAAGDKKAECSVTVVGSAYFGVLEINAETVTLFEKDSFSVTGKISVNGVKTDCIFTLESSDETVAKTEENRIIGVKAGTAKVTVRAEHDGEPLEREITVTVKENVSFYISGDNVKLAVSEVNEEDAKEKTVSAVLSVKGERKDDVTISWQSENPKVATVDGGGKISAVASGETKVYARCSLSDKTYSAWVNVTVYKSKVKTVYDIGENDLSYDTLKIRTEDIGLKGVSGEASLLEINGGKVYTAEISSGEIIARGAKTMKFGKQNYVIELSDRFVEVTVLNVTKVLKTKEDVKNIISVCGGESGKTYSGYLVLGNNIDFGGEEISGANDLPVTKDSAAGFQGTFDGRGFVIANAKITRQGGLFERVGRNAVIKNLSLVNIDFAAKGVYNGVLALEFYGLLENYHFQGVFSGNALELGGIAGYSNSITVKNSVLEICAKGEKGNSAAICWIQTSGTSWENVYSVGDVPFINNNPELATERGNGVKKYGWNEIGSADFSSLPLDVWNCDGELPVFVKEYGFVATYKVEYYKENVLAETRRFKAGDGAKVYASDAGYPGYTVDRTADNLNSGTVKSDGTLVLKLYYTKFDEIPVGNASGKGTLTTGGSTKNVLLKSVGAVNGKNAFMYKMFSNETWDNRLNLSGIDNGSVKGKYNAFEFYVYYTDNSDLYIDVYFATTNGFDNVTSYAGSGYKTAENYNYIRIYDKDGKTVLKTAPGEWYKIVLNLSDIPTSAPNKNFNLSNMVEGEIYFADASFINADFTGELKKADYTVNHYKKINGVYEVFATETLKGVVGQPVTAIAKTEKGFFVETNNSAAIPDGIVTEDGNLTLALYYGEGVAIGNSEDKAYLYSLSKGPVFGSSAIVMEKLDRSLGGRNDVYSYVQTGADVVRIVGITNDYLTINGYNKLSMKLYFTGDFVAERLYFHLYSSSGNVEIRLNAGNLGGYPGNGRYRMTDANGNVITDITEALKNTWITFEILLDGIQNNANAVGLNLEMRVNEVNYNKPLYLADVKFVKEEEYGGISVAGADGAKLASKVQTKGTGAYSLDVSVAGEYHGKTNAYRVTEKSVTRRAQGLTLTGVSAEDLKAKNLTKLSFEIYYEGNGHAVTAFGYSDSNYTAKVFAATMSIDQTSYITYKDSDGNPVTNIKAGGWYSVEIDISELAANTRISEKNINLWIFDELNTEYFIANARFV